MLSTAPGQEAKKGYSLDFLQHEGILCVYMFVHNIPFLQ